MTEQRIEILVLVGSLLLFLLLVFFTYGVLFKQLKKYAAKTETQLDDFIVELFKVAAPWLIFWICIKVFSRVYLSKFGFYSVLSHINSILLIISLGWIFMKGTKAVSYLFQRRLDIGKADNLKARKSLTQLKVFEAIIDALIVIVVISLSLLTFDDAKDIGMGMLTSAGIAGVIIGLAAQKSLSMILAGIQIAITQPIRLDDVVIVEGEWGRIEEITLTYVVVKIWDERQLILPVTWFLEKPFENWTKSTSDILGTIFLHLDYSVPVEKIREELTRLVTGNENWDNRVANVQITDSSERTMEVRLLVSSKNSGKNWDLRVEVREKMIGFLNANYPGCFVKARLVIEEKSP